MEGVTHLNVRWRSLSDFKHFSSYLVGMLCFIQAIPVVYGQCPKRVQDHANACMADYSTQFQNMQSDRRKLFSGMDVEPLRAFCSGYKQSMACIEVLKRNCSNNSQEAYPKIDTALLNLKGARTALTDLCKDDNLYEVYARFRTCFVTEGPASEYCFTRIMNVSIQLLTTLDYKSTDELCSDMRQVMQCIKSNIELHCGMEASTIVEKLVRPMVRGSSQCSFIEIPMTVNDGENTTPTYKSGGRRSNTRDSGDNGTNFSHSRTLSCVYLILFLVVVLLC
ncbi:uncharacterized protein LOC135471534 [Liolophura sinensis]|uniref:uncharacterized protein LOC135471534 n=1 Tax=Liolophura sinensis TaxID=3198878 RepID=UPI0031585F77